MFTPSHVSAIQSMTGYGEASYERAEVYLHVAIKSVNSKYLDLDAHLPRAFAHKEMVWRELFSHHMKRGKVSFTLICQLHNFDPKTLINEALLTSYSSFLKQLCTKLGIQTNLLPAALRLPGVVRPEATYSVPPRIHELAFRAVEEALAHCVQSREEEGTRLIRQLSSCLIKLRQGVHKLDDCIVDQKKVLQTKLEERLNSQEFTPSEWEQELNTYVGKFSIEEEKVRLQSHLTFFEKTLDQGGIVGKKLAFILQEITRELNTLGAKAQYGPLQHLAVDMKEAVEQMREQIANLV